MNQIQLLRKYNVPGPRYTSYPTVPYWSVSPTQDQWLQSVVNQVNEGQAQGIGLAIYVHIPFCESLCTYCGCNTRITRNHEVETPYVDSVIEEWNLYCKALGKSESNPLLLSELHLGGGTPTFLSPSELTRLMDGILKNCVLAPDAEFSVEADPRVTSRDHLAALASRGFKRLSLGVQDFDPKVQDIVHRIQSEEQVKRVSEEGRALGYTSVNFDLIYGLPFQTLESVRQTMEAVRRLRPDRIAFYAYAHVPWIKPGQRRFSEADLPSGEVKRALYELGREMLESVGYREIGMDHFALETDSLWVASQSKKLHRNFMGYTARLVTPLIGLGVSAIGDSWTAFAQNEKVVEKYQERIKRGEIPIFRGHVLDGEDLILRRHILNLMTHSKTSWAAPQDWTAFLDSVPPKLKEFIDDGLVKLLSDGLEVNPEGVPFLRNICMAFDARLARQAPQTNLFSKTI